MKILNVTKVITHIIETDAEDFSTYRRLDENNWEVRMAMNWEPLCFDLAQRMEDLYQSALVEP